MKGFLLWGHKGSEPARCRRFSFSRIFVSLPSTGDAGRVYPLRNFTLRISVPTAETKILSGEIFGRHPSASGLLCRENGHPLIKSHTHYTLGRTLLLISFTRHWLPPNWQTSD